MLSKSYNLTCFKRYAQGTDVAVVEGVMGLFDGYDGKTEDGSTAQMAKWLGLPVILVVDAKRMARSVAALLQGFEQFDKDLTFAGVLFNNVGSNRHLGYLKEALPGCVQMPCLGGIIHDKEITIPERHLGLVTRQDHPLSGDSIDRLSQTVENAMDIDALISRLPDIHLEEDQPHADVFDRAPLVRIGVAKDNAFCFYYQDNLDILRACGAELIFFSPILENKLPENLDGLYLGGGYPELFAEKLAQNINLRAQIQQKSVEGLPIYGECGGFMYLCREIWDHNGNNYPMTGCFPFSTKMLSRRKALGYREIRLSKDTIIGKQGFIVRGHEFHYSEVTALPEDIETIYEVADRAGLQNTTEGFELARCLGSYIHLHFGSRPETARYFVNTCREYRNERIK
jgi:cobyrinic acid a,c-diamide synthase